MHASALFADRIATAMTRCTRGVLPTLLLACCVGCTMLGVRSEPAASTVAASTCAPPAGRDVPPGWCGLPAAVRAFVDDRDACDHFRGEPWPESDSAADSARRREILDGLRTACAGTDARLAQLKQQFAADATVMRLLGEFEDRVE